MQYSDNAKVKRLLKTARGQIDGILRMLEEERFCIDISTQISATQSILKKVNIAIISNHLSHCVKESFEQDNEIEKQKNIDEFVMLLNKIMK